jgi:PLP dependent protein
MAFEFLQENLRELKSQIEQTCDSCKRDSQTVRLLAVTKNHPVEKIQKLYELGERHFAENRVQELLTKVELLPSDTVWHIIGPLQSNKVRPAVRFAKFIHSVDSLKILEKIAKIANEEKCYPKIFLQVNLTAEDQKSGFAEDELDQAVSVALSYSSVELVGFMTMGAVDDTEVETAKVFRRLCGIRDRFKEKSRSIKELSMGMSGDFKLAIAEGSTCIRVGSLLLGERKY